MTLLSNIIRSSYNTTENFQSGGAANKKKLITQLIVWVIIQTITVFLGRFLWNKYLVKAVSVINPITSVVQMLGIAILINLLFA